MVQTVLLCCSGRASYFRCPPSGIGHDVDLSTLTQCKCVLTAVEEVHRANMPCTQPADKPGAVAIRASGLIAGRTIHVALCTYRPNHYPQPKANGPHDA